MNRKQWLEERKSGIGGSDASAIIGANPYKTNVQLWEEKTGRREAEDIGHKSYVQYGIKAEKHLIELFKLDYPQYKVVSKQYDLKRNPDYPFVFVTPDAELVERGTGRKGGLEIKTTEILSSMHREKWKESVPQNYYIQVLQYFLANPDYEFVWLRPLLKAEYSGKIRSTIKDEYYERKDLQDDLTYLLEQEIKFWNEYVVPGKEPPLRLPQI